MVSYLLECCYLRRIPEKDKVASRPKSCYAPVGTVEFGDGRGAVMALEAKYRPDGESRMQELQDQLTNLQVRG